MRANTTTTAKILRCIVAAVGALTLFFAASFAMAASLTVLPVTIQMAPGQMATALTIIDQGESGTAFQVRAFAWTQQNDGDILQPTDAVLASPPLGTLAAGASQVVRVVLRRSPEAREASYRILLDQIPPPAAPGTVRIALRLSIPIFAEPETRVAPHVRWQVEHRSGQSFLVAANDGTRHETVHDIRLTAPDGRVLRVEANVSPYVLAGATRRWRIVTSRGSSAFGGALRLTASTDTGRIDQPVRIIGSQ